MKQMLPLAVLAAALGLAVLHPAMSSAPARAEAAKLGTDPDLEHWRGQVREARDRVRAAHTELSEAEHAYAEMRHRDRRGNTRAQVVTRLEDAKREVAAAEAALPEVVEQARRAGLPPGELRELELD